MSARSSILLTCAISTVGTLLLCSCAAVSVMAEATALRTIAATAIARGAILETVGAAAGRTAGPSIISRSAGLAIRPGPFRLKAPGGEFQFSFEKQGSIFNLKRGSSRIAQIRQVGDEYVTRGQHGIMIHSRIVDHGRRIEHFERLNGKEIPAGHHLVISRNRLAQYNANGQFVGYVELPANLASSAPDVVILSLIAVGGAHFNQDNQTRIIAQSEWWRIWSYEPTKRTGQGTVEYFSN